MPPILPASAPLTFAHPSRCIRTIPRGAVKRCLGSPGSQLVAWQVCCPACGFVGSYLPEEGGAVGSNFVEGPWVTDTGAPRPVAAPLAFKRPGTLEMLRPVVCFGCRGLLRVTGGAVVVEAPAPGG